MDCTFDNDKKTREECVTKDLVDEKAVDRCLTELKTWCERYALPKDHGWDHFVAVYQHAKQAVRYCATSLTKNEITSILIACLLHDMDDRKIKMCFAKLIETDDKLSARLPFATAILEQCGCESYMALVLELIDLVSTSVNGNSIQLPAEERWKYIPRDCDRLEALGQIGICRVIHGCRRAGLPFVTARTPLPLTRQEIETVLQVRPLPLYMTRKTSDSTLDHFYDKLLHLHVVASNNTYIQRENRLRMEEIWTWLTKINAKLTQQS